MNRQDRRALIKKGKCPDNYHPRNEKLTGAASDLIARVVVNHTGDAKFPEGFVEVLFALRGALVENVGEWEPSWHNRIRVAVADVPHIALAGEVFDENLEESHATFADGVKIPFEYVAKLASIRDIITPLIERDGGFVFTFRSNEAAWNNDAELSTSEYAKPVH